VYGRFGEVHGRFDEVYGRFDEVNRRFNALDTKIDSRFTWMIGTETAVLLAVIGALLGAYFR
jgi:hypothetical protein